MTRTAATTPRPIPPGPAIFDCDGTLVATEGVWDAAYTTIFDRYHTPLHRSDRHRLIGLTLDALGHELARLLHRPHLHRELGTEALTLVTKNLDRDLIALPGAIELITALAGHRPIGIASNNLHTVVTEYLTRIGIIDMIDVIVGSDDVTAPKPAPDVYLRACHLLATDPTEAVAIDDSVTGVVAARAAGLYVIAVPSQPDLPLPADAIYPNLADPRLMEAVRARHRQTRHPVAADG